MKHFDIFISYSRENSEQAKFLAGLLSRSYSVFLDVEQLTPGIPWDDDIEEVLTNVKAVVVLWSKKSVQSKHVKNEAAEADDRNTLIPVLIEESELPFRYKRIHTVSLNLGDMTQSADDISVLLREIENKVGTNANAVKQHLRTLIESPVEGSIKLGPDRDLTFVDVPAKTIWKALMHHLLLGMGFIYIDRGGLRKWLYVVFPAYAIVSLLLAYSGLYPFYGTNFGYTSFTISVVLYMLSFFDVATTYYRQYKR